MAAPDNPLSSPTAPAALLLRAALLDGPAAAEAWHAWLKQVPLDGARPADYALLPLVYTNLARLGAGAPDLGRLKGIYRKTWVENHPCERSLAQAADLLHQAGVPALIPGSVALARGWYADFGARVCDDPVILVQHYRAEAAHAALRAGGWREARAHRSPVSQPTDPHPCPPVRWQSRDETAHFALSTHLLHESRYHETDQHWWPHASRFALPSVAALTLSPADHLLWACVLGMRGNSAPPLRWAADAWHVAMRRDVDWDHLIQTAAALRLTLPLAAALKLLEATLGAAAPAEAIHRLGALPVTSTERRYYHLSARPRGLLGEAPVFLADFRRLAEQGRVRGLAAFLRDAWGLADARHVPAHALRRLAAWRVRRPQQPLHV
jgi:hypothetical protein